MKNYGASIQGRRNNNQDRYIIYEPNSDTTFLGIADGMGGMVGGDIASSLAIDSAKSIINDSFKKQVDPTNLKTIMRKVYSATQYSIKSEIEKKTNLLGMGTTLACVLIYKDHFVIGNIGDSRVYLIQNDKFQLITKDHSFIDTLSSDDKINVTEDMVNKYGHLLTKSINGGDDIPDIFPETSLFEQLEPGTKFLLCSDGLLFEKYGKEIHIFNEKLIESNSPDEFVNNLINFAYEKGSLDNITCITSWNL